MATLVEPPFGATSITPKPFAIWPLIFAILLCNVMASPCCTMKVWKVSRRAINSLDDLSVLFWYTFSCRASKSCPFHDVLGPVCPLSPFGFIQQNQQKIAPIVGVFWRMQVHMHQQLFVWVMNFFISFVLFGNYKRLLHWQAHICFNSSLALGNGGWSPFLDQSFVDLAPSFLFFSHFYKEEPS